MLLPMPSLTSSLSPCHHPMMHWLQLQEGNEVQTLLGSTTGQWLEKLKIPGTTVSIYCDKSAGRSRIYDPAPQQHQVFQSNHDLSHPGTKATAERVIQRFVWRGVQKDCRTRVHACQSCQRSKVSHWATLPRRQAVFFAYM
jgi:hypothetical protein